MTDLRPHRYTVITVCHAADREMLVRQARSLSLYADRDLIADIRVVDNDPQPMDLDFRRKLLAAYGPLEGQVDIAPGHWTEGPGWWSQQAEKLLCASECGDRALILDAKTHLVRPLTREFLEALDGRPRTNGYGYDDHPLRPRLESVCKLVGIDPVAAVRMFIRTSTPFVVHPTVAEAAIAEVGRHAGLQELGLPTAMGVLNATEFFLIGAVLERAGALREVYDWSLRFCPDLWNWGASDDDLVAKQLARCSDTEAGPFLSIHRGAFPLLSPKSRLRLAELWADRGLERHVVDAITAIDKQASDHQ